jgi:hypothetical protein
MFRGFLRQGRRYFAYLQSFQPFLPVQQVRIEVFDGYPSFVQDLRTSVLTQLSALTGLAPPLTPSMRYRAIPGISVNAEASLRRISPSLCKPFFQAQGISCKRAPAPPHTLPEDNGGSSGSGKYRNREPLPCPSSRGRPVRVIPVPGLQHDCQPCQCHLWLPREFVFKSLSESSKRIHVLDSTLCQYSHPGLNGNFRINPQGSLFMSPSETQGSAPLPHRRIHPRFPGFFFFFFFSSGLQSFPILFHQGNPSPVVITRDTLNARACRPQPLYSFRVLRGGAA